MKIAMIAPPWLPIPPVGYGGTENVLAVLVPALMELGAEVELFTISATTLKATKNHSIYNTDQYQFVHDPWYYSMPILMAQALFAFNKIRDAGNFDIIHSHSTFVEPFAGAYADDLPPIVHTLHGPPFTTPDTLAPNVADNLPLWKEIGRSQTGRRPRNVHLIGISNAMLTSAPKELKPILLKPVHNGIDPSHFPFITKKSDYFVSLGRSSPEKGWGIAVRTCLNLGYPLKLAGLVANMSRPREVLMELANPLSTYRSMSDFRYFSDEIFPYLQDGKVEYLGSISGQRKLDFLGHAKGFLFPVQWEEPFGMVAIEALACGTPVVAMARGALPEIIKHGSNGFLAKNETEFEHYMQRVGEIDPAACRKSVEENFSARHMAEEYLKRYAQVLTTTARHRYAKSKQGLKAKAL